MSRSSPRLAALAAGAMAAAVALAAPSEVHAESDVPVGKFGLATGLRQNMGELGDSFGSGWLVGVEAGYQPSRTGDTYSLGVGWSVMWGWFGPDDPSIVESSLRVLEMNFGLRFRRLMSQRAPRFISASAGVTLLRTNVPVPPDMDRLYVGPYAGLAYEEYLLGKYLFTLEGRYGMFAGGPPSLSLLLGISFGSR